MSMMKRVVEEAEELGVDWFGKNTEEVLQEIADMKFAEANGADVGA